MNSELELVARLRKRAPQIGDDCAVVPSGSEDLLFTTDMMVEGVHFLPGYPADAVGRKTIARGVSDIAAMGGTPKFCLMSLALPRWSRGAWLNRFHEGVFAELKRYKMELIGGDLSRSESFVCDVTVCGGLPNGTALLRSGARPGDGIYVSGELGAAASRGYRIPPVPRAQVAFGKRLRGIATACMDISDGLSLDLHRLCLESKVSAYLDIVPAHRSATVEQALHGGEDYELLFTAPATTGAKIAGAIRIGTVHRGRPGSVFLNGEPLKPGGHDHFKSRE